MYSVVLMAALTTGGQAQDWCFKHQSSFAGGDCHGYACYGSCYGGGYGAYTTGGYAGGYSGGSGGCYGSVGYCTGGYGIVGYASYGCHGCYGCYGCYGCTGYAPGLYPGVFPASPAAPKDGETLPPPKKDGESLAPNKARLIVTLPADATLTVDGRPMKATSDRRSFQTPELAKGQTFYYEVRAEVTRDGKPISQTKRVLLKAGEEVLADFKDMDAAATAKSQ
jgi:uncharacterized protein (TIGR03000 family)